MIIMNLGKFKDVQKEIIINIVFFILLLISAIFPYFSEDLFMFEEFGLLWLGFGGYEGLFLVLLAIIFILYYKIRFAIIFQVISCCSLFFNLFYILGTSHPLSFGIIFLVICLCGFAVNIFFLFKIRNLEKEHAEQKFQVMLKRTGGGGNIKNRLFGMIKVEKQLNLKTIQEMLKIPKEDIKALIYELVGEGKLEGEFQDEVFLISSDIDEFLEALDSSFQGWEQAIHKKEKKI